MNPHARWKSKNLPSMVSSLRKNERKPSDLEKTIEVMKVKKLG